MRSHRARVGPENACRLGGGGGVCEAFAAVAVTVCLFGTTNKPLLRRRLGGFATALDNAPFGQAGDQAEPTNDAMFPISDENPTLRTPVMTIAILAVTWAVWLFVQGAGNPVAIAISVCNYGMIPGELTHLARLGDGVPLGIVNGRQLSCIVHNATINLVTPVLAMFLHGSWSHIIGNSLYLWVFGNNIEDSMGRGRFLAFYLLCGLIAAGAHVAWSPASLVPTVGASGAISGIMGAYLLLYPRVPIRTYFPPIFLFHVPAWSMLIIWFVSQVVAALPQVRPFDRDVGGGVAVWAHIGGFVAGLILVKLFSSAEYLQRRKAATDAKVVWS